MCLDLCWDLSTCDLITQNMSTRSAQSLRWGCFIDCDLLVQHCTLTGALRIMNGLDKWPLVCLIILEKPETNFGVLHANLHHLRGAATLCFCTRLKACSVDTTMCRRIPHICKTNRCSKWARRCEFVSSCNITAPLRNIFYTAIMNWWILKWWKRLAERFSAWNVFNASIKVDPSVCWSVLKICKYKTGLQQSSRINFLSLSCVEFWHQIVLFLLSDHDKSSKYLANLAVMIKTPDSWC